MDLKAKVSQTLHNYSELEAELAAPETAADPSRMEKLGREYRTLSKSVPLLRKFEELHNRIDSGKKMLQTERDQDMIEMARDEIEECQEELEKIEPDIKLILVPRDENDGKNAIIEIRAGTGGVEAGIFAADLYRMYEHYISEHGWRIEPISTSYGEVGAIKEVIFMVTGENAYGTLKYESGVHRVQRVPQTESQGRVHTSAASVAVMPEADEMAMDIDPQDLRIDVYRASGAGGQHVNKTESAVRIVHIPTGVTVTCQDEKSQHKNKAKALKVLQSRLFDAQNAEREAAEAANRKSMVGTGDRSAKIRTYNYPQGRVTDHRINLTLYKLDSIMNGDIDELVESLSIADLNERMKLQA